MSDYDAEWENSGHFPSSKKSRPIIAKKNDGKSSKFLVNQSPFAKNLKNHPIVAKIDDDNGIDDDDVDPIFMDGEFDTLATINNGSLGVTPKSNDSLMGLSHSSSETPAISNTTTTVVRKAIKKSKEVKRTGDDGRIETILPYNVFRSKPDGTNEGKEKSQRPVPQLPPPPPRQPQRKQKAAPQNTSVNQFPKTDLKGDSDEQPKVKSPPVRIAPLLSPMVDEPSSVITEDHNHNEEHNQYVFDYMAEGENVQPPMSVMSARSRRHGGGSKHHMVRHTLPTSQKVTANPSNMLSNLFISIEEERHLHRLTAQHLRAIHNWLLFLPSILLTLFAGLVVLIFEADIQLADDRSQVYSSVAVGVLSLVSVLLQALTKQLDLGTKSALHDACSVALKRLSEDILLTVSATADTIPAEYVALIGEKYGQAADACPLMIPYKLEAASSYLSDRMVLMLRPPMGQAPDKEPRKSIDLLRLYATAYDELTAEVINHFAFPIHIPDPRKASQTALRSFKSIVTEGKEVGRRWYLKSLLCPCLGDDEERSLFDVASTAVVVGDPTRSHSQRSI